jgi:hypothetical protein
MGFVVLEALILILGGYRADFLRQAVELRSHPLNEHGEA